MMGMCSSWESADRLLVHACLVTLLPVATDGLRDAQLHGLLSTIWHEASNALMAASSCGLCP